MQHLSLLQPGSLPRRLSWPQVCFTASYGTVPKAKSRRGDAASPSGEGLVNPPQSSMVTFSYAVFTMLLARMMRFSRSRFKSNADTWLTMCYTMRIGTIAIYHMVLGKLILKAAHASASCHCSLHSSETAHYAKQKLYES